MRTMGSFTKLILLGFIVQLTGCANYSAMMRHSETKDIQHCTSSGMGIVGVFMANSSHEECTKTFKDLGYVPIKDEMKKEP